MKIIDLDLAQCSKDPIVKPFQVKTPLQDLMFKNHSDEILTVTFESNLAFAFSHQQLILPAGQFLSLNFAPEWNIIYTVSGPDRPRTRAAIITVIQPIDSDPNPESVKRFLIRETDAEPEITPLQAETKPTDSLVFENQFKDDIELRFLAATPLEGPVSFSVGPKGNRNLKIATQWRFPFHIRGVEETSSFKKAEFILKVEP